MKVMISGGGTGGHIYPALALIRTMKAKHPDIEFLYIGTKHGLEAKLVPRENISFHAIQIMGFKRSLSLSNIKTVLLFFKGLWESKKILHQFQPDIVIGTGGYVCGPVVYAAAKKRIPTIIHEQNSIPGLTNTFLSRYVDKVAICFEHVRDFFPSHKAVLTGNPRATEVMGKWNKNILSTFQLKNDVPTVLIFGGSRGAKPINNAVINGLAVWKEKPYQILYVTGEAHFSQVEKELSIIGTASNIKVVPFIYEMPQILQAVDLVVSRAGATTLAEITAVGIPSILIPSPYVTNNHQEKNAHMLVEKGASEMLLEEALTSEKLVEKIDLIMLNEHKRKTMTKSAKAIGIPDAADRLFSLMMEIVEKKPSI